MRHQAEARPSSFSRVLGVLGELLITAGISVFLFLVWQLWWTDVLADREQSRLVGAFYDEVEERPGGEGSAPEYRSDPPLPGSAGGSGGNGGSTAEGSGGGGDDGGYSIPDSIGTDNIWAVLHIPAFGDDYAVGIAEGVDLNGVLDRGSLGHYPETQLPGEPGNFALAGHRQSYGAALWSQPDLEIGAPLIVETADTYYVYRVTEHEIVAPSAVEVLAPVPGEPGLSPNGHHLTLTTCHPPFVSNQRWITFAELDYWTPRAEGTPKEL